MKFRYKVLFVNLIILSVVLGFTGYLLVYRNYTQSLEVELRNATSENNMVKASVEYELLDLLNSSEGKNAFARDMGRVIKRVDSSMLLSGSTLYVKYADEYVFSGDNMENLVPDELFSDESSAAGAGASGPLSTGKKYIYHNGADGHYLYVSSPGFLNDSSLTIITKKNLSNVYDQLAANLRFLKIISIIVLFISAVIIYLVSRLMTRPLENLNSITTRISGGDYSVRADIKSDDEVGKLAENFNLMAGSVEENVEELKSMIHRREQFVADFTHEMKTPMTTIIGYADSVRHLDMTDEERDMSLEYIYTEGKRLETMSQKLFDLLYLKNSTVFMEEQDVQELGEETILHMKPIL
ncbi:MAG: HAMP domain-containing protein [Eubacterium sp.]|nr:HAMP domain-containing protein [Eubacterium sp.]